VELLLVSRIEKEKKKKFYYLISFLFLFIGSFIVKHLKSKDMFASRYRSSMNYKSENQSENKSAYSDKLHSVQSILSFTEEDARALLAGLPARELEPGQDFI
jgi:hypothetical protein